MQPLSDQPTHPLKSKINKHVSVLKFFLRTGLTMAEINDIIKGKEDLDWRALKTHIISTLPNDHPLRQKRVPCKFGDKCTRIGECKFKHSKNSQPCKYGENCIFRPNCKFSHDDLLDKTSQPASSQLCRFGETCRNKKACKYGH